MRNLTVLRKNAIPGSKKTVDVYIEDHEKPTITIEDTPCRQLGSLQCCEQKTFPVGEEAAAVYVLDPGAEYILIGDKTQIPAGEKDLYLTGRVRYRKDAPFRFDGPATGQAPSYHPVAGKKTLIVAIAITATLLAPLLINHMPSPGHENDGTITMPIESYDREGISIDLPGNFEEAQVEGYTLTYTTRDVALFMLKEPFAESEEPDFADWTLDKYIEQVAVKNRIDPKNIQMNGQIPYYTYDYTGTDGSKFCYYVFTYKSADAFWMLNFAIEQGDRELYEPAIFQWADSVRFSS